MAGRFEFADEHIIQRLMKRYRKLPDILAAQNALERVKQILINNTPDDWRFTESPSSRFFILDDQTEAKFMGLSYRHSDIGEQIVQFIQTHITDTAKIQKNLKDFVDDCVKDVCNPALPIVHNIRTVYGKKEGTISEEIDLFKKTQDALQEHVIPISSHKIAARPNAVIWEDDLWARQHLNWINIDPNSQKEYYFFQPLRKRGIDKSIFAIFSYSINGDLRLVGEKGSVACSGCSHVMHDLRSQIDQDRIRSESYWKIPSFLGRRYIDLNFKENYSMKSPKKEDEIDKESLINASEALELCFLKEIVKRVRNKLHR